MLNKLLKNRVIAGVLIGALISVFLIIVAFIYGNGIEKWHLKLADGLYTRSEASENIVIIAIDDKSTQPFPLGLGRFTQWERDNYAMLLQVLENDKPKVVAFDFLFNNPSKYDQEADDQFAAAIKDAGNVILEFAASKDSEIFPLKKFSENAELGLIWATPDTDGVDRRIPIYYQSEDGQSYDSLALAATGKFLGENITDIPLENDKLIINYFGDPFGYKMVPFIDVIDGNVEPGTFKDKLVFVGITSFKEIQDKTLSPKSNEVPMAGVEVHANIAQTILEGKYLVNQSSIGQAATTALIAIGLTVLLNYLGILFSIIAAAAAFGGYLAMAHVSYRNGIIVNMIYPFAAIILAYLSSWIYKYFVADKKKREMKSAFGHYVSDKLVNEISKNPEMVKLGGEKKIITVFFSDLKDSTKISEQIEISNWVSQINEYFTVMENIIKKLDGTIDKYEGDAIMGFFNAPISQEDHQIRAYIAALEMNKALNFANQKWTKEGRPALNFRVGINTGEALVGNFGSKSRFDYTVMGDTVNTASRLESAANKTYGTSIIVSGIEKMRPEDLSKIMMRELDTVILPGKNDPVKLFELVCLVSELTSEIKTLLDTYAAGLAAYRNKDFVGAVKAFESLQNDIPAQVMLERSRKLVQGEKVPGLNEETMVFSIFNK